MAFEIKFLPRPTRLSVIWALTMSVASKHHPLLLHVLTWLCYSSSRSQLKSHIVHSREGSVVVSGNGLHSQTVWLQVLALDTIGLVWIMCPSWSQTLVKVMEYSVLPLGAKGMGWAESGEEMIYHDKSGNVGQEEEAGAGITCLLRCRAMFCTLWPLCSSSMILVLFVCHVCYYLINIFIIPFLYLDLI